jgi:hypothetical protein
MHVSSTRVFFRECLADVLFAIKLRHGGMQQVAPTLKSVLLVLHNVFTQESGSK